MEQMVFMGMETEEGRQAVSLHNDIMRAKDSAANAMLDMCRGLKTMRDSKAYKALGFESFEQYSVNAVGIKYRMAATYISAYENLGEKMIAEHADIGVTKLNLLAQISDPEKRADAAKEDLDGMTVAEVKALVAEKNSLQEQLSFLGSENKKLKNAVAEQAAKADTATVEATVLPADIEEIVAKAKAEGAAQAAEEAAKNAEAEKEQLRKRLEEQQRAAKEAEEKLEKAKADAKKKEKKLEEQKLAAVAEAKRQAAAEATDKAKREAEKKVAGELEAAKAAEQAAKAEAEKLLKKLEVQSDAETVKFGLFLQQLQQAVNGMSEQIGALREGGKAEQAEKLNGVMQKILRIKLEESEGGKKE